MVTKQRIEITKQMEFKNLYTSQIENKGSTQVQNIFTNIGNIFNIFGIRHSYKYNRNSRRGRELWKII